MERHQSVLLCKCSAQSLILGITIVFALSQSYPERRYDNIQGSDTVYGKDCNGTEERFFWGNFLRIVPFTNRVSYSFCTCYEGGSSDRFFSLREAVASATENRYCVVISSGFICSKCPSLESLQESVFGSKIVSFTCRFRRDNLEWKDTWTRAR